MFESLLWSDPRPSSNFPEPFNGCYPSDRGAGVEYGADITNTFCGKNRIALCVRSHECIPEGFEVVHGGRVITIFSASCYCGMMTNKGAFLSIGQTLQPEIQQFYAQSLVQSTFTEKIMSQRQQLLEDETLKMIQERIIDKKADLYWFYNQADNKKTGKISKLEWANGMRSVLQLDLPFLSYCTKLTNVTNNLVDYNSFLTRYQIQMRNEDINWQNSIVDKVCSKLFLVCSDIKTAFEAFDTNKDGTIDYNEFYALLSSLDVGLSNDQIYDLMRSFDVNNSNTISYSEFAQKMQIPFDVFKGNLRKVQESYKNPTFVKQMKEIAAGIGNKFSDSTKAYDSIENKKDGVLLDSFQEFIESLKIKISKNDSENLYNAIATEPTTGLKYSEFVSAFKVSTSVADWNTTLIQQIANVLFQNRLQLRSAFRLFDLNNDGKISKEEFFKAVSNMNLQLDTPITMDQVTHIMNSLDKDGNGTLDYKEFFDGFKIVDTQKKKKQ